MKKNSCLKWIILACLTLPAFVSAQQTHVNLTGEMVGAVRSLLNSLSAEQNAMANYAFDDEERLNWHFIPRSRNGLSFNDLSAEQQVLALDVMRTFLSSEGYEKMQQIRSLESVLAEIEVNGRFVRDPDAYFLTVFGEPSAEGTWAFRFEGHHIALNWTFVGGSGIASSPQFFGTNPALVQSGPQAGLRVLHAEEDLGRQLAASLTAAQRNQAVLQTQVPRDIFTSAEDEVEPLEDTGIAYGDLDPSQQALLVSLIEEVAGTQTELIAEQRMTNIRNHLGEVKFTWIGGTGMTDPHYYRIQGPSFLIEYDKTQNDANHIHLVWRDFDGDFGRDLIRLHYDSIATEFGSGHQH